jgi:hypothetical protein
MRGACKICDCPCKGLAVPLADASAKAASGGAANVLEERLPQVLQAVSVKQCIAPRERKDGRVVYGPVDSSAAGSLDRDARGQGLGQEVAGNHETHFIGIDREALVSGGANIDVFWRIRSRHGGEAPPMATFATSGRVDQVGVSSGRRSFMR